MKPHATNVLDYPCMMSGFERESLAAEAKLKVKVVLTIRCPTCGAARGVRCRVENPSRWNGGGLRIGLFNLIAEALEFPDLAARYSL
jgi:hypothetical protein